MNVSVNKHNYPKLTFVKSIISLIDMKPSTPEICKPVFQS